MLKLIIDSREKQLFNSIKERDLDWKELPLIVTNFRFAFLVDKFMKAKKLEKIHFFNEIKSIDKIFHLKKFPVKINFKDYNNTPPLEIRLNEVDDREELINIIVNRELESERNRKIEV